MSSSNKQQLLSAFAHIDVLKELAPASQLALAGFTTLRAVRKGETLFCQGEPSPYCFGVLSGEVTLVKNPRHAEPTAQVVARGSFFGGDSLLQELPRPCLATASQDGELISIWSSRFREWKENAVAKETIVNDIQHALQKQPPF